MIWQIPDDDYGGVYTQKPASQNEEVDLFDDNDDEILSQMFTSSPKKVETASKEIENILGKWKDALGLDELSNEEQSEENK